MPFTPYHFGPGLLLKSLAPGKFSLSAFVVTQVVIDCEPLYFMIRSEYPVHRTMHTFLGATIVGAVCATLILGASKLFSKMMPNCFDRFHRSWPSISSEFSSSVGIFVGGIVGGASHPLLDGFMHGDMHPFWPWTDATPLLGMIPLDILYTGCLIAGILGIVLLSIPLLVEGRAG